MKLVIKQLFGKYDYDLEFDNKLNILIGENGCGKSTILKIISYLVNKDMCALSKINFEYISISNSKESENIYREDIVQQNIVNQYDFRRRLFDFVTHYNFTEENGKSIDFEDFYLDLLNELNKNIIFQKCEDFDNFDEFIEKDFLMFGFNYDLRNFDSYIYINEVNSPYGSKNYFSYFYNLAIAYIHGNKQPFTFDDNEKENKFDKIVNIINQEKNHLQSNTKIYDFTYFSDKIQKKHFNTYKQYENILKLLKENSHALKNNHKYLYLPNYFNHDEIVKIYNIIDIIIENEKKYSILDRPLFFLDYSEELEILQKFYLDLKNYFNSDDSSAGYFETRNYNVFPMCKYIADNYDFIKDDFYSNEQIKKFSQIINKYITTKSISLNDKMNYEITDNLTGKSISFENLSSGEKKIINLIEIICFSKNDNKSNILLLDEPELSLSIFWQEMILDDLLESEFKKIIICTQSPNLLSEETIKYIIEVKK